MAFAGWVHVDNGLWLPIAGHGYTYLTLVSGGDKPASAKTAEPEIDSLAEDE